MPINDSAKRETPRAHFLHRPDCICCELWHQEPLLWLSLQEVPGFFAAELPFLGAAGPWGDSWKTGRPAAWGSSHALHSQEPSSSAFPPIALGLTIKKWWDFCVCDRLFVCLFFVKSNHRGSYILSSWTVHAGCVFVAGIHPSRTWVSGSFESVRWNACVYRPDLSLYSHLNT